MLPAAALIPPAFLHAFDIRPLFKEITAEELLQFLKEFTPLFHDINKIILGYFMKLDLNRFNIGDEIAALDWTPGWFMGEIRGIFEYRYDGEETNFEPYKDDVQLLQEQGVKAQQNGDIEVLENVQKTLAILSTCNGNRPDESCIKMEGRFCVRFHNSLRSAHAAAAPDSEHPLRFYLVHYTGWKQHYDEWIPMFGAGPNRISLRNVAPTRCFDFKLGQDLQVSYWCHETPHSVKRVDQAATVMDILPSYAAGHPFASAIERMRRGIAFDKPPSEWYNQGLNFLVVPKYESCFYIRGLRVSCAYLL